jgi:hypothetical protein
MGGAPGAPPALAPDQLKAIRDAAREGARELTPEQRTILYHFGKASVERQAIALWMLSDDPHYLEEFESAALERGLAAKELVDALTAQLSQPKPSRGSR